jgi:hypothetical protein
METLILMAFFMALFGVLQKYSGNFVNIHKEHRFASGSSRFENSFANKFRN